MGEGKAPRAGQRDAAQAPRPADGSPVRVGLVCYAVSSGVVVVAVAFIAAIVKTDRAFFNFFARWDGEHYATICRDGYSYDPNRGSIVAFFPAYPLLARPLTWLPGVSPKAALVIVSHLCLAAAFVLLAAYIPQRPAPAPAGLTAYTLLALGVVPITFFFRMAYSESLFLLVLAAAFSAMQRQAPLGLIALLVGFATAVRAVGVALIPPFWLALWQRSAGWGSFGLRAAALTPVACWGLIAYMLYLGWAFGDPLAFAKTQRHWAIQTDDWPTKLTALLTLEPFWGMFDPSSPGYWRIQDPHHGPLFSLYRANPFYFGAAVVLVAVGAVKGWLTTREWLLAALLLAIPYATRSHEMCMASAGRFASVAFPVYLVLGHLLCRLPKGLAAVLLTLSGLVLAIYSAKFALHHAFYY